MIVTVDIVILTIEDNKIKVLLQKRKKEPHMGQAALPGGYVFEDKDTSTLDTAHRVLKTKLGLEPPYLEQYKAISSANRDSRGWSITDVYITIVPLSYLTPMPEDCALVEINALGNLPMGHKEIIEGAFNRVQATVAYSSLPVHFFDKPFTLYALKNIYELFKGDTINKVTFRRYIEELDVLQKTGDKDRTRACAPADLYELKPQHRNAIIKIDRGM